jgi:cytochrome P450/ferredoxin-NADP reductase
MMSAPIYDVDFYSDAFIRDPWPHYAKMRDLGPLVFLPRHDNYALTRHDAVFRALQDPGVFISGKGVAADAFANSITLGNSAASDGERHHAIRQATSAPLLPGALEKVRGQVEIAAEQLIDRLVGLETFDAMKDLATHLPLTIVRDLVGLPDFGKENMLRWASATFDLLGVQNERGKAALDLFLEQRKFVQTHTDPAAMSPGSWTRRLWELVEDGALAPDLAPVCMRDYLNPSLDTTISATGQLIWRLGANPEQWRLLRAQPELARNAANEAVRMASPVRSFARHTSRPTLVEGYAIPEGARVMLLFASANRDERVFERPDSFDITRNPRRHLGFGSGIHMCVGMHLAQMEMIALLQAMIPRVREIHVDEPIVALNNTIHGFSSLPTRFVAVTTREGVQERKLPSSAAPPPAPLLRGRVFSREKLAENVIGFEVAPVDGHAFPDWSPGAHIDIHIRDGLIRQYSLTGNPGDGRYLVAVQLEKDSKGGSKTVHASFAEGAPVTLSRPRNHFALDETAAHCLLFSGGIGMTPIMAMAWRLHGLRRGFRWHLSARSLARLPWADRIDALPFRDNITLHISDGLKGRRLDASAAMADMPEGTHVYICGPAGYRNSVADAARAAGIPSDRLHQEHFGAEIDVNGDPFTIVLARSGLRIDVSADETILEAMTKMGIEAPTACRNGVCGSCLTRIIEGRPDHRDMVLTGAEKSENDRIALCCSRSRSAVLVIDI